MCDWDPKQHEMAFSVRVITVEITVIMSDIVADVAVVLSELWRFSILFYYILLSAGQK